MENAVEELRNKARQLLESRRVAVVIGYANGSGRQVRAVFIRDPAATGKLIFDERCQQNLAVYLLKPEIRKIGKPALVATLPVLRSVLQLIQENQLAEEDLELLGIDGNGRLLEWPDFQAVETYLASQDLNLAAADRQAVEKLEKMSLAERRRFWQEELSRCFKCYACRAACPLCYCGRCTVECNQPQWISVPAHDLGNLEWHMMRAMHLAGRCVGCGECGRACPLQIPIHLLTFKMAEEVFRRFGLRPGTARKQAHALSTFKPNDTDDFIG